MKHITRWRPDTCGCVLELEWDDQHPEDAREHRPVKIERCGAHDHPGKPNEHVFGLVHGENQHKNRVHAALIASLGEDHVETMANGDQRLRHAPQFDFDVERRLRVTFPNAPAHLKPALEEAAIVVIAQASQ
jgi:hypothetical protein